MGAWAPDPAGEVNPAPLGDRVRELELRVRELETQMRAVRGAGVLMGTFLVGLILWVIGQSAGIPS